LFGCPDQLPLSAALELFLLSGVVVVRDDIMQKGSCELMALLQAEGCLEVGLLRDTAWKLLRQYGPAFFS
jgi:hypothetical protein